MANLTLSKKETESTKESVFLKEKKMEVKRSLCSVLFVVVLVMSWDCGVGENLQQECAEDMAKLMGCLSYVSAKGTTTPSKECCSSVKDIREREPKCLCYIMQQTHNGSDQAKRLGIQEAKLFSLPSACQLQNVTLSDCPKMLGISPSSPDAAIFTNANQTTPAGASATTTPTSEDDSDGNKQRPFVAGSIVIAMLVHALFMTNRWA